MVAAAEVCAVTLTPAGKTASRFECKPRKALLDTGAQMSVIGEALVPKGAIRHDCGIKEQMYGACAAPIATRGFALLNVQSAAGCPAVTHWAQVTEDPPTPGTADLVLGLNYMAGADLVLRPKAGKSPKAWCPRRRAKP